MPSLLQPVPQMGPWLSVTQADPGIASAVTHWASVVQRMHVPPPLEQKLARQDGPIELAAGEDALGFAFCGGRHGYLVRTLLPRGGSARREDSWEKS